MTKIIVGPAGTPAKTTLEGLKICKEAGLKAMEIEFVRGVKMQNETAKAIAEENKKYNISLSIHAPYYINLASSEKEKQKASIKRILDSCERGHYLKAKYIIFHAGYYMKKTKEETFEIIQQQIKKMQNTIKQNNWNVILCPETTGKKTQFGSIEELYNLHKKTGCGVCVDFAHILARNQTINYEDAVKKFSKFPENKRTTHFSGIAYGEKGEKHHIPLKKEWILKLLNPIKKQKINTRIICESPNPFEDAKKILKQI